MLDPFVDSLEKNGVEVDLSPRFAFGSYLMNQNVTRLDKNWLAKSIDKKHAVTFEKWKTNSNKLCQSDFWPGCDRSEEEVVIPLTKDRI